METSFFEQNAPKFYGATTVGERGQVVIPAEARRDFEITPTTKLLVFGSRGHGGLMIRDLSPGLPEYLLVLKKCLKWIGIQTRVVNNIYLHPC